MNRVIAIILMGYWLSLPSHARSIVVYPGNFSSNTWNQAQLMHLQTQQQLQAQDIYRRQLLNQDLQRQMDRLEDQRIEDDLRLNSLMMRQHTDRLRSLSRPAIGKTAK